MKLSVILVSFLVAFISLNQSFAEVYTTGSVADNNGNITVIVLAMLLLVENNLT